MCKSSIVVARVIMQRDCKWGHILYQSNPTTYVVSFAIQINIWRHEISTTGRGVLATLYIHVFMYLSTSENIPPFSLLGLAILKAVKPKLGLVLALQLP